MAKIPREFVREVVDRTSIVSLVSQTVRLKKRGSAHLGLCPFHNEKTPSFHVNEDRKNFHCFGCGKSGDALDWMQEIEGLGFLDAVKELADRAGMAVPQEELTPRQIEAAKKRERLLEANEAACRWFQSMLAGEDGTFAREYLQDRGYDMEFAKTWRIGFAPESWDGLRIELQRRRLSPQVGVEASLLKRSDRGREPYDFFRNRLMFPILGSGRKVVAFGGRTLGDDKAKYINSSETPVYNKSGALYGLQENRRGIHKADNVLVVEGYFDVLALAKAGIDYAVAPCGTALTDRQLAGIRRHTANVTMLFDADEAGRRAAVRVMEMCLDQGLWPLRLEVPGGKDPDDYVKEHGADAMRQLLSDATPLLDFFIDTVAEELIARSIDADGALEKVAPMLARLGMGNTRYEHYERRVIQAVGIHTDPRSIKRVVKQAAKRIASQPRRSSVELTARPPAAPSAGPLGPGGPPRSPRNGPGGPPRGPARPPSRQGPGGGPDDFDDWIPPDDDEAPPMDELGDIDFDAPAGAPPSPSRSAPRLRAVPRREPPPTPPQLELLRLLVQDQTNVARAIADYGVEAWIEQPSVHTVLHRFLAAVDEERQPTARDLLAEIELPAIREAVGAALADPESWYGPELLEASTQECLLRLRREYVARRYVQVKRELDAMQRASAPGPEILHLTQESLLLQREREELDQHLRRG